MTRELKFGYLPLDLNFEVEGLSVSTIQNRPLPDDGWIVGGWFFGNKNPFNLPMTHCIRSSNESSDTFLKFVVRIMSFFAGMRLTTEAYGFKANTPIKNGSFVDFISHPQDLQIAVQLAGRYWSQHGRELAKKLDYLIHVYFLAQEKGLWGYERLPLQYAAFDLASQICADHKDFKLKSCGSTACRFFATMEKLGVRVPESMQLNGECKKSLSGKSKKTGSCCAKSLFVECRNELVHEATILGSPIGYVATEDQLNQLDVQHSLSRLIVALFLGDQRNRVEYISSDYMQDRQRQSIKLEATQGVA